MKKNEKIKNVYLEEIMSDYELSDSTKTAIEEIIEVGPSYGYYKGYLIDLFHEGADSNISIYNHELLEEASNMVNMYYIDEALEEYGQRNSLIEIIQQGLFYRITSEMYEKEDLIKKAFAVNYLNLIKKHLSFEEIDEVFNDADFEKMEEIAEALEVA